MHRLTLLPGVYLFGLWWILGFRLPSHSWLWLPTAWCMWAASVGRERVEIEGSDVVVQGRLRRTVFRRDAVRSVDVQRIDVLGFGYGAHVNVPRAHLSDGRQIVLRPLACSPPASTARIVGYLLHGNHSIGPTPNSDVHAPPPEVGDSSPAGRFNRRSISATLPLTRFVGAHPVQWAVISGVLGALYVALLRLPLETVVIVSTAFGALNWWLWRAGGSGHEFRAFLVRRFPRG